jgi:hypothetical protein
MRPRSIVFDDKNLGCFAFGRATIARVRDRFRHESFKRCLCKGFGRADHGSRLRTDAMGRLLQDICGANFGDVEGHHV